MTTARISIITRHCLAALAVSLIASHAYGTDKPANASQPQSQSPLTDGPIIPWGYNAHLPPFASENFTVFNRQDIAAIALREWRLFGSPVADEDPHTLPNPSSSALKPERLPGLWQRIGEYWWLSQDPGEVTSGWTGRTNEKGELFSTSEDGNFAWSAAFISYVMRIGGANTRFPYSANHSAYINAAASGKHPGIRARNPASYAPRIGDVLCVGRGRSRAITYKMLPTDNFFPAHCGIVVAVDQQGPPFQQQISVVGGNVNDTVALTHVPTDSTGHVSDPEGNSYDTRYPWCAILAPRYAAAKDPDNGK